jgi:alpha-tubulin suppressor-like RCC1 family protein
LNQLHSSVSDQVANTFCEVWCFGSNDLGQLGLGNTVPRYILLFYTFEQYEFCRRVPSKVKLPKCPVIKLAAGDNFTVALLATGELYGWGSNENFQLKLENTHLAEPTLIKVSLLFSFVLFNLKIIIY